jgi:hypothetical protein
MNHQGTKGTKEGKNILWIKANRIDRQNKMAWGKEFFKSKVFFVVLGALGALVVKKGLVF